MYQLAQGISAVHKAGFIHSDIKLENILVFRDTSGIKLKIVDFGFADTYDVNKQQVISR